MFTLRTYSELCLAFGVTPTDTPNLPTIQPLKEGETDPVFDWLVAHERVIKGPNPRGWYAIHCPWEAEHTGEVDHGTDYSPGRPGAFKCLHGHCEGKTTADLRGWIEKQDPAAALGPIAPAAVRTIGEQLGKALGVDPEALAAASGAGGGAGAPDGGVALRRLQQALQRQAAAGTMFSPPPPPAAPGDTSLTGLLSSRLREIYLDPSLVPDPDMTAGGRVATTQTTTPPRVHHVMDLIGMKVRQNVLTGAIEARFETVPEYTPEIDTVEGAVGALIHCCARCGMRGAEAVRQSLASRAGENCYSPVLEWIKSTPWDGRSRFPELTRSIIMRDPAQEKWKVAALRRWFIQCIIAMRNFERGLDAIDVGHVLVLQGAQGVGKSRWVKSLMPAQWVTDGMSLRLDMNERDAVKRATATPITELGEIDGSFRRSDIAALKNFLTTRVDLYRPAYGRTEVARPRGTSFVATVNPEGFLLDQTGERRFWPLAVERCNWMHGADMQQFWAEVLTWQEAGEPFWLQPGELEMHAEAARAHMADSDVGFVVDELRVRREAFLDHGLWGIYTVREVASRFNMKAMTAVYSDLNAALQRAGFERQRSKTKRGWLLPPLEQALTPAQQAGLRVLAGGREVSPEAKN